MSLKLVTVTCLLALSQSSVSERVVPRIIGGRDAKPGEFPYQVSLQTGSSPDQTAHFCGGSILNANWIITAGHCATFIKEHSNKDTSFVVKAGKRNLYEVEASEQVSIMEKYIIYPQYEETQDNAVDIALIKLEKPFKLNKKVSAINLPKKGSDPIGTATLSGWGATKTSEAIPAILQTVNLPIVSRPACIKYLQAYGDTNPNIKDSTVCAGLDRSGCSGDSGSPLAQKQSGKVVLVAVTSWASVPCEAKNFPTGFVRVSLFLDWINSTMKSNK